MQNNVEPEVTLFDPPAPSEEQIKQNADLMRKSFKNILIFLISMTIALVIVILCQSRKLFIFNFTNNYLSDDSELWFFRIIMVGIVFSSVVYSIWFIVKYYQRKKMDIGKQSTTYEVFKKWFDRLDLLTVVPVFLAVITFASGFIFSTAVVEQESMQPTYYAGDRVIIYYFFETYTNNDVVIVDATTQLLIKRIIGIPGDYLVVDATGVYVNTIQIADNVPSGYIPYDGTIPEGKYFIMGDNSTNSEDSRIDGFYNEDQLLGKVIYPEG
ncbi:MAG: signal peptidase I [Candidatus Izemoplasmatales bacterium]|jgi:signal peptidase I|nr:signal peptidase I [Candidatus Izemoplasmatales bacterium]MDD3865700.1 signal peptidase I [Candidatus Izemoplasmatales bacterium]